jgi:hypothetical protein
MQRGQPDSQDTKLDRVLEMMSAFGTQYSHSSLALEGARIWTYGQGGAGRTTDGLHGEGTTGKTSPPNNSLLRELRRVTSGAVERLAGQRSVPMLLKLSDEERLECGEIAVLTNSRVRWLNYHDKADTGLLAMAAVDQ